MKKISWPAILLLGVFFTIALLSLNNKALTVDETVYISSGYSYYKTGDLRLNPEHPPLTKYIVAFPMLFIQPELPIPSEEWDNRLQWDFGQLMYFHLGNDPDQILYWGRFMMILLGVVLGIYVYLFAKELYGENAALGALFLYALSPNIIAHSSLSTTDLGAVAFIFIAVYHFWKFLKNPSPKTIIISGIALGLAFLAKFTAIFLLPIFGLIILWKLKTNVPKIIQTSLITGGIVLIAIAVIATGYLFQFDILADGLDDVTDHSKRGHRGFLLGEHSSDGWWYYFIVAFVVKTPIPTMILIILALIYFNKTKHKSAESFLVIPIIILFSAFFFNKINIGLRHVLPIYPFLFVYVSKVVNVHWKLRTKQIIFGLLALWYVGSAFFIHPHQLAYFNEFAGGPGNGHKILIDSNIDWGQDLIRLKQELDANGVDQVYLGYFGMDDYRYRGINAIQFQCFPNTGVHAVSASSFEGLDRSQRECTSWLRDYEPTAKAGYSIFIYDLRAVAFDPDATCREQCKQGCTSAGLTYHSYTITNASCDCNCVGNLNS